jgi:hypothetical protein
MMKDSRGQCSVGGSDPGLAGTEAAKAAVCFYGVDLLPRLRALEREQLAALAREASEISCTTPLHMASGPHRLEGWEGELTGLQVVALMVFGLYVLQLENPDLCEPLMEAWPIADVLFLVDGPSFPSPRKEARQ